MKIIKRALIGIAIAVIGLFTAPLAATAAECTTEQVNTIDTWDLQRSDWVAGTPATIVEGWYTESDDAAPTVSDDGLTFTAPGGQAVGIRTATSFPLAELSGESYTDVFHDRAVLDADGEPFGAGNWRNDYTSLTFLTTDTVWVSGLNVVKTLAEVKAEYTGTITSFGYHMDSNASAGTTYTVNDLVVPSTPDSYTDWYTVESGQGVLPDGHEYDVEFQTDGLYRYTLTGTTTETVQVPVECPAVVEPTTPSDTPAAPTAVTTEPVAAELAETGVNDGAYLIMGAVALCIIVVGGVLYGVARRTRGADRA